MEYPRLETATLGQVTEAYYFGVTCQICHRAIRLSLERLTQLLGPDYPLVKIRHRLKCRSCLSRKVIVAFLAPNEAVGKLAALFNEPMV